MGANKLLKANQGKKTVLDIEYSKHIISIIDKLDEDTEARWETYSLILEEMKNQGVGDFYTELKYRLTDGDNPNEIILDIVERNSDSVNNVIWMLKKRVEEYLDEDYIKRFY